MVCRRRIHRLRSRKWPFVIIVFILFLCILLTYISLTSQDASPNLQTYFPTSDTGKNEDTSMDLKHKNHQRQTYHAGKTNPEQSVHPSGKFDGKVKEVLTLLYPKTWAVAKEADEMALLLKDRMLDMNLSSPMSCKDITDQQVLGSLGSSFHKYVDKVDIPNSNTGGWDPYAAQNFNYNSHSQTAKVMKSQTDDVDTKVACLKQVKNFDFCQSMSNYLMMREIFLLRFLQHPNLIGLLGYCLRGDSMARDVPRKGLILVLELGVPIMPSLLTTLSWSRRVKMAHDVASLMAYMHQSPLGSVGLPRVQTNDFVLVNDKTLKLTDLDDIDVEERACTSNEDCYLHSSDIGVTCKMGRCQGLNHKTNLRVIGNEVLIPLLQNPPLEARTGVEEALTRIRHLDISSKELLDVVKSLVNRYSFPDVPSHPVKIHKPPQAENGAKVAVHDVIQQEQSIEENMEAKNYIRINTSNFPGQFDYPCADTRVSWGCVMVFDNLQAAMVKCTIDNICKAFVVFSSHPDHDNRVTVVFKNDNKAMPKVGLGTTLFIKRDTVLVSRNNNKTLDNVPENKDSIDKNNSTSGTKNDKGTGKNNETAKPDFSVKVDPWAKVREMQECVNAVHNEQTDALRVREKRIMTIMGLKGLREDEWQKLVSIESVSNYTKLRLSAASGGQGGSMLIEFSMLPEGHTLKQAKFMVEKGPRRNHVAFAMIYTLDRLFGLYHVPPTVEGFLKKSVVTAFAANQTWHSAFSNLTHLDGTLRGLYIAPTPKILKHAPMILKPLPRITSEVHFFNHTQKQHLEYVLLSWLGHIDKPNTTHRGFKGHLIHMDADLGFQDLNASYSGFLYHCQFPSIVHQTLSCFLCPDNRVCLLGQEIVRKISSSGLKLSDLGIPQGMEPDYPTVINEAASDILAITDKCIQRFGREAVLY